MQQLDENLLDGKSPETRLTARVEILERGHETHRYLIDEARSALNNVWGKLRARFIVLDETRTHLGQVDEKLFAIVKRTAEMTTSLDRLSLKVDFADERMQKISEKTLQRFKETRDPPAEIDGGQQNDSTRIWDELKSIRSWITKHTTDKVGRHAITAPEEWLKNANEAINRLRDRVANIEKAWAGAAPQTEQTAVSVTTVNQEEFVKADHVPWDWEHATGQWWIEFTTQMEKAGALNALVQRTIAPEVERLNCTIRRVYELEQALAGQKLQREWVGQFDAKLTSLERLLDVMNKRINLLWDWKRRIDTVEAACLVDGRTSWWKRVFKRGRNVNPTSNASPTS